MNHLHVCSCLSCCIFVVYLIHLSLQLSLWLFIIFTMIYVKACHPHDGIAIFKVGALPRTTIYQPWSFLLTCRILTLYFFLIKSGFLVCYRNINPFCFVCSLTASIGNVLLFLFFNNLINCFSLTFV